MGRYDEWKLPQLKTELRNRKARVSGRKKELIERLESYDRNANFGTTASENIAPEWYMHLPDPTLYKDVTSSSCLPAVNKDDAEVYLRRYGTLFDKNSRDLYAERFVRYVRSASTDGLAFIKAQCRAKMRRTLVYNIDIKLDGNGIIVECQCDCAAGMGPRAHCKHMRAVLRALIDHTKSLSMVLELTCTEQVQSFHRPKRLHQGSPVKGCHLNLGKHADAAFIFNPIPETLKETYENARSRISHLSVNFAANTGIMPAVLQLIPPANIYALHHDHDYLEMSPDRLFLKQQEVTEMSEERRQAVNTMTVLQSNRKEWFAERTKRITASNFGRICKATDKTDHRKLARSLMTFKEIHAKSLKHGKEYEDVAVRKYTESTGVNVRRSGLVIGDSKPYLAGSPDGIIRQQKIVEVKCPYTSREMLISHQTVPYLKLEADGNLTLQANHDYMYQVQGNLYLTGAAECDFIVYTFLDLKVVNVKRNDSFIQDMLKRLDTFFENHYVPTFLSTSLYRNTHQYLW